MLNSLLVCILVYNIAYILLVLRLRKNHCKIYIDLESPAIIPVSIRKFSNVIEFIFKMRFSKLNDPILTLLCMFCGISFLVTVILMLLYVSLK
jgi:hypothetical protein